MRRVVLAMVALAAGACTHALEVVNAQQYVVPVSYSRAAPVEVAIEPFAGRADAQWYFNVLVERLAAEPTVKAVQTDYRIGAEPAGEGGPDLVLALAPSVEYRSSVWNFFINWPGFLIFTPAWNGYVYRADVYTQVTVRDGSGNLLSEIDVPISYSIREADGDRCALANVSWLEVSAIALISGVYNAIVFDRDSIPALTAAVRGNYTDYVLGKLRPALAMASPPRSL